MKKIHTAVSFWRSFGVAIVCWTALGLFQGRVLLVNDRDHANYLPYAHYVVWAGIDAFSWAMITPFIFLFARRFPLQSQHWLSRLAQYAVLCSVVVLAQPALKSPARLYKPDPARTLCSDDLSPGTEGTATNHPGLSIPVFSERISEHETRGAMESIARG